MNRKLFRRFVALFLGFLLVMAATYHFVAEQETFHFVAEQETIVITDDLGREVEVPADIESVLGTGSVSQIVLYTLAFDKMVGWNSRPFDDQMEFLPGEAQELDEVGSIFGRNAINTEEIVRLAPSLIIDMGNIKDDIAEELDQLQEQTEIPVVFFEADSLEDYPMLYAKLGDLLDIDTTEQIAFLEDSLTLAEDLKAQANEDTPNYYFASGDDGLLTAPGGDFRTEVFELIGLPNVYERAEGERGNTEVSSEQLLEWQPETIFFNFVKDTSILEELPWSELDAVSEGKVYEIPSRPFPWASGPKSVNAYLGLHWLGDLFYTDSYGEDLAEQIKRFYELFYHYELSDEQVSELLNTQLSQ